MIASPFAEIGRERDLTRTRRPTPGSTNSPDFRDRSANTDKSLATFFDMPSFLAVLAAEGNPVVILKGARIRITLEYHSYTLVDLNRVDCCTLIVSLRTCRCCWRAVESRADRGRPAPALSKRNVDDEPAAEHGQGGRAIGENRRQHGEDRASGRRVRLAQAKSSKSSL